MAINDVSISEVYGTNAGVYNGNAIPSAITSSANKFLIIPLADAISKANSGGIEFLNAPSETSFDTASDVGMLSVACQYSYGILHSKAAPSYNLRKFDASYFGYGLDNNSFEANKVFQTFPFSITFYEETTALSNTYNPVTNTLT